MAPTPLETRLLHLFSDFTAAALAYGADPDRHTYMAMARTRALLRAEVLIQARKVARQARKLSRLCSY